MRIQQNPRFVGSGCGTGKRPKCEKNELGFVYVIKDDFLRPDTNFQQNRLKTVELVPATKCVADHLVNYQS